VAQNTAGVDRKRVRKGAFAPLKKQSILGNAPWPGVQIRPYEYDQSPPFGIRRAVNTDPTSIGAPMIAVYSEGPTPRPPWRFAGHLNLSTSF
jgi:hypothetical protein